MNAKKTTNPKKDKNTVPTKNMYSTLDGLESLCRRAMVYHKTGEYLTPDPLPNICKNKYKRKAGPSKKIPNKTQNKSTMFGKGRVGVSCEAYGVKHCACCNPHIRQNIPSNETSNYSYDVNNMIANINKDTVLIVSDDSIDYSPPPNRINSKIIKLHDSSHESSTPHAFKINFDKSIVSVPSDEDLDECSAVSLLPNRNGNDFLSSSHNVNLDNNDVIPTIDLDLIVDKDKLPPTSKIELKNNLLSKREQIQKEIDECERNIKTIFTKNKIKYLLPKQTISTSPKIKEKVELTRQELLQKEIDDCDRDFQKIFKKKTNIILPSQTVKTLKNKSNLTSNKIPHNIQNTSNNPIQTQIENIVTTYKNSRTPLQELNKTNKNPANVNTSVTPYSHRIGCCPICFDSFENKELMSTICGHIFCMECIKQVIKTTRACPTCRNRLSLKRIHPIYL